jgi:nicotinamidase/pyrazinamidase
MLSNDNKNYLLAFIASLVAIILFVVYCLAPPPVQDGARWYAFCFDCIPDAFVATIAIPIVYGLFVRRGITGLNADEPSAQSTKEFGVGVSDQYLMRNIPSETAKASIPETAGAGTTQVLIVVDVQNDFVNGSLKAHKAHKVLQPINDAIKLAQSNRLLVIFTRDWHPENHWSFKGHGRHCVMNDPGAEISSKVDVPADSLIVNFGVNQGDVAYSALENPSLTMLLDNPRIESVYVVGIALNYCVKCTCLSITDLGKSTFTIDEAIASADGDLDANNAAWKELEDQGVHRLPTVAAFANKLSHNNRVNRSGESGGI